MDLGITGLTAAQTEAAFTALLVFHVLGIVAFALAFWWTTRSGAVLPPTRLSVVLLGLQTTYGLLITVEFVYIMAAELSFILVDRAAVLWLLIQSTALVAVGLVSASSGEFVPLEGMSHTPWGVVVGITIVSVLAWQVFAFCVGYIAATEARGRRELARVNAELLATQQLLSDSSRSEVRLRIARELHDTLGHHLAALSLHLELACRLAAGTIAEAMQTARDLAKRLLTEVRNAVSTLREERNLDLKRALETLCAGIPEPRIQLSWPEEEIEFQDPAVAHALFRCVQEAVANAVKHARARHLWVALSYDFGGLALIVRDDGQGAATIVPGNGLTGMRERMEELGGRLEIESRSSQGFALHFWLPQPKR